MNSSADSDSSVVYTPPSNMDDPFILEVPADIAAEWTAKGVGLPLQSEVGTALNSPLNSSAFPTPIARNGVNLVYLPILIRTLDEQEKSLGMKPNENVNTGTVPLPQEAGLAFSRDQGPHEAIQESVMPLTPPSSAVKVKLPKVQKASDKHDFESAPNESPSTYGQKHRELNDIVDKLQNIKTWGRNHLEPERVETSCSPVISTMPMVCTLDLQEEKTLPACFEAFDTIARPIPEQVERGEDGTRPSWVQKLEKLRKDFQKSRVKALPKDQTRKADQSTPTCKPGPVPEQPEPSTAKDPASSYSSTWGGRGCCPGCDQCCPTDFKTYDYGNVSLRTEGAESIAHTRKNPVETACVIKQCSVCLRGVAIHPTQTCDNNCPYCGFPLDISCEAPMHRSSKSKSRFMAVRHGSKLPTFKNALALFGIDGERISYLLLEHTHAELVSRRPFFLPEFSKAYVVVIAEMGNGANHDLFDPKDQHSESNENEDAEAYQSPSSSKGGEHREDGHCRAEDCIMCNEVHGYWPTGAQYNEPTIPSGAAPGTKPTRQPPEDLYVTYWATIETENDALHIPLDSANVSGPGQVIVNNGLKKVWKWVQEKGLEDKIGLSEAYALAKDMYGEEGKDVEVRTQGSSWSEVDKAKGEGVKGAHGKNGWPPGQPYAPGFELRGQWRS